MTARQLLQRLRQSTESTTRNPIYRKTALTATTTTAQRHHITELATLHKDSSVANTVMSSFLSGAQTALTVSGISPIAAGPTSGLPQEANKSLETQRQEVTESISIEAETGLRVYIPQRLEY